MRRTKPIALVPLALSAVVALAGCSSAPEGGSSQPIDAPIEGDLTMLDPVVERAAHTATPLLDGQVLLAGGCVIDGCGEATDTSELFDPAAGRFALAAAMTSPRSGHSATMLPNGDALIVGGYAGEGEPPLASAELYDTAHGTFIDVGAMSIGRGAHAATLLSDGRVLIAGGWVGPRTFTSTTEIWDPASRTFTPSGPLQTARGGATATTLNSGDVLLVGGEDAPAHGLRSTEIYEPDSDQWRAGPELTVARFKHATATTGDGDVFVIGGTSDDVNLIATVERFDGGSFRPAGRLTEGRYKFSDAVVTLPDGRLLVAGGGRNPEVYDPATARGTIIEGVGSGRTSFATATLLADGRALIVGGYDDRIDLRRVAYIVQP